MLRRSRRAQREQVPGKESPPLKTTPQPEELALTERPVEVDEADALEQARAVPFDEDEDYPRQ